MYEPLRESGETIIFSFDNFIAAPQHNFQLLLEVMGLTSGAQTEALIAGTQNPDKKYADVIPDVSAQWLRRIDNLYHDCLEGCLK